ncbi:MAG: CRTAC1 family protein [Phaeodactylibacter sp.]|nr:CRTAC1 family protein [Phaeodactylibacter sp.]MCB9303942.1 CRTAC1 family protein [Lewinellaceae bacterium]
MKKLLFIISFLVTAGAVFSQASFLDASAQAGINNSGKNYGVAFGDFDNDGLEDIYISRHTLPNLLYRATGNGQFVDVAAQAGVAHQGTTTMSVWGDIDNDGDLDLYLGNRDEPNILYRNNGNGTFTDISASAGVNSSYRTRAVLFGDVDQDGFIDLYVANLSDPNYLYHNNGNNTFTNIVEEAGAQDLGVAMGSLFFDYDNDGDLDLYLTHDANQPYILYQNDGSGHFTNVSAAANADYAGQGMGVDFGDLNNDGFLDLYITNLYSNALLLNNGNGAFTEITAMAGVGDTGMGWGTVWLDYDNDGWQDIYMSNDSYYSPDPNILYRNRGNLTFEAVSQNSPLASMYGGYGAGGADLNSDGRIDLFQANSGNDGNQLFLNQTNTGNNWVKIKLTGTTSNRAAIGARVRVTANGKSHIDELCAGSGYATQNSFTLHFGLGQSTLIDALEVRWPNGLVEVFTELEVNRTYRITEGEGMVVNQSDPQKSAEPSLAVFPSPFTDVLHFQLELPENDVIQLTATDINGREVARLAQGRFGAGSHTFEWAPGAIPAGVYLCQAITSRGKKVVRVVYSR